MPETTRKHPLIIGHRGDCSNAPENTMAAFRMALDKGADGIEFDVQLSRDGVPVVIHDHGLGRTALRPEMIAELMAKELGNIDVGSWFNRKFPAKAQDAFAGETIPTLAEVLGLTGLPGKTIYIELKCRDRDCSPLAAAVCEMIRDSPMLRQMIVKSFNLAVIPTVRHLLSDVQTAALFEPSIMLALRRRKYIIDCARKVGAHQISLHYSLATPKLTTLAVEAKMPVTIWTAADPKWIERCRERNIAAIITNDPQTLLAARNRV